MPATRDQEVDIAYALEVVPHVVGVYALALPPSAQNHVDATPFGVVLRPYTGEALASAHFALLDASSYEVTASIAYADAALSRLFQDARRLVVEPGERDAARSRFLERSSANLHVRRLEQAAMAEAFQRSFQAGEIGREVRLSLKSGVFELLPDPFPTAKLPLATVLVLDDDPGTADIVRQLGEVELVVAKDTWTALAHATERRFDLVLCTRTFDERPVDALSAMLISTRGELSGRIVVLGRDLGGPEPSSQSGRAMPVLTRPLTSDILRRLLARVSK